jgi:CubicO group peptidase (beta-lactamase class C family)
MNSGLRENLTFERPPDTAFFYNTPAYAVVLRVLEGAAKHSLDDLTRQWLTVPLGMADTSWRMRPNATAGPNARGLVTTPRDIAKIGQLVLDGGRAPDGTVVVSRAQMDAMFVRTATNPAYGRLWWLNGGEWWVASAANARRTEGALIPAAPPDTVAAMGAMDRKLFVVPSLKLIVVRTGPAAPDRDVNQQLWLRIAKALTEK